MINAYCRCPYRGRMTIFTNIRCLDMHQALAGCLNAIVTANAVTNDIYMVEIGRHPGCRKMTVITGVATRNMIGMFAGCRGAVVTAHTIAKHIGVIEHGRNPAR